MIHVASLLLLLDSKTVTSRQVIYRVSLIYYDYSIYFFWGIFNFALARSCLKAKLLLLKLLLVLFFILVLFYFYFFKKRVQQITPPPPPAPRCCSAAGSNALRTQWLVGRVQFLLTLCTNSVVSTVISSPPLVQAQGSSNNASKFCISFNVGSVKHIVLAVRLLPVSLLLTTRISFLFFDLK